MLTLDRVARRGSGGDHSIQLPYAGLRRLGVSLGRKQVSMIAAAPGIGKSQIANDIVQHLGVPTLYESPDTDDWTMTIRTMARNSGHPQDYVRMCLAGGHHDDTLDVALRLARHVHYSFDSYTTADIRDDVLAYQVVHGAAPELIVVDTLMNIAGAGDDSLGRQQKTMEELHALAQLTGANVMVLHHVQGAYNAGDRPVPLNGIVNQVSQLPSTILTLYAKDNDVFVCPVKNRTGRADPSAQLQVRLHFDKERGTFRGDA